jgi:hypothetical protein
LKASLAFRGSGLNAGAFEGEGAAAGALEFPAWFGLGGKAGGV